jgi:hypothetical protein
MVRNTAIEKSLDKKMKPRYDGPMIAVRRSRNGDYVVATMAGAVLRQKVAKFRVIPYFARRRIAIPDNISDILDTDPEILDKLEELEPDETMITRDYLNEGVNLVGLQLETMSHTETEYF